MKLKKKKICREGLCARQWLAKNVGFRIREIYFCDLAYGLKRII